MGISSDGILYFGFVVSEEEYPEWMEGFEDFDDFVCSKAGLSENASYEERAPVIKSCPAELQSYCSSDYPMYILGVRGAEHRAYRGDVVEIGPKELFIAEDKIAAFKQWCDCNGIEWQEPKWLLCSMYG